MASDEKYALFQIILLYVTWHFCLVLSRFLLISDFQKFDNDILSHGFLLSCLEFAEIPGYLNLYLPSNWGSLLPLWEVTPPFQEQNL